MATVYLALGSNVGDSERHIEQAIGLLGSALNTIQRAPLYHSKAVGYTDQADFLNTVIRGETSLTPVELLEFIQATEKEIGRRKTFRWGPREIDIDIIFYDDLEMETETLTLPHPEFRGRDFVLRPLSDLNSGLVDPVTGLTMAQLLAKIASRKRSIL